MRVAFLSVYQPRADGIADYAAKSVHALRQIDGIEVDVFSLAVDGVAEAGQEAVLSMDPRSWWRLRRRLATGGYQVVHLQFDLATYLALIGPIALVLASLRARGGPRLVATYHDAYADRRLYGAAAVAFYRAFSRLFDRIYVHTEPARACLIDDYKVAPAKVVCIELGTFEFPTGDVDHQALRARWDLGDAPVVLSFGFIYRTKGIEVLIDAVDRLARSGVAPPRVIIAGRPATRRGIFRPLEARNHRYLAELKAQVARCGLEGVVTFVGYVPGGELYSLFTLADLVVLSYLVVDQSAVLNMAIGAGTPVVASDIGGLRETLADVGVLVPAGSAEELADTLVRLLRSPDELARLRADYRALAGRLSTEAVARRVADDYTRLVGPGSPPVVQVSAYYPPHPGGQQQVVEQLAQALDGAGVDVSVVTSHLPRVTGHPDPVPVRRLRAVEVAHTPLLPGLPWALARAARGAVVHVHTGQAYVPEVTAGLCRLLGRPYVVHVHLMVRPSGPFGALLPGYQRWLLGPVLRRAAAVVCLTEAMRREIVETYGVAAEATEVIPNGIDGARFASLSRAPLAGRVLFVGRLTAQKNLGVVIRAMAELADCQLVVAGDGEDRPGLESLVAELGITNVCFRGQLGAEEIAEEMATASVLVLPSTHEGMPLVLLEAASAGLPALVSDIPELAGLGLAAGLLAPEDPRAWAKAIAEATADPASLAPGAAAATAAAAGLAWGAVVPGWLELYRRVATGR